MNGEFKDQSNYLVGFLAAVVGLAAFKAELQTHVVSVFGHQFSFFMLAVPMVGCMLLATYIGGLAFLAGNVSFTLFPLRKYLSIASSTVAGVGLIYPLALGLLLLLSWVSTQINSQTVAQSVKYAGPLITVLAAFYASSVNARYKSTKNMREYLDAVLHTQQALTEMQKKQQGVSKDFVFLRAYDSLVQLASDYLKLLGYGVGRQGLLQLAHTLQQKNVFEPRDVDFAGIITKARNNHAHGKQALKQQEIPELLDNITLLRRKIEQAMYELNDLGR